MEGDGCTSESEGEGQVIVVEGIAASEGEHCAAREGDRRGRVVAAEDGVVLQLQGNVGEHRSPGSGQAMAMSPGRGGVAVAPVPPGGGGATYANTGERGGASMREGEGLVAVAT